MRRACLISTVLHIVIILAVILSPSMRMRSAYRPLTVTWVELPRGSGEQLTPEVKKIDRLPRTTIQDLKEPPKKPEDIMPEPKKIAEKKKPEPIKPKKQLSAIEKALAKLDQKTKERPPTAEAAQVEETKGGFEGAKGDKPVNVSPRDLEYIKYQTMIRSRISSAWFNTIRSTPEAETNYTASLEVLINEEGEVTSIRWMQPSNNPSFDASCVRAIRKASPLPKPPERLAWEAYNEGFLVEFDPKRGDVY